jgi:small-conductance mechanosensitive channel
MSDLATVIDQLKDILFWLPRWASASIIIASVCAVALCLHGLALRFVRRSRAGKAAFTKLLIMRAANPTRFAIVLLALAAVVPVSGLPSATQQQFIAPLTSLFILLVGWSCLAAVGLAGDVYLDRFKTGFEDALARKHVTQVRLLRRAVQVLMALITVGAAMMTLPAIRQYGVSLFASAGAAGIVVGLAARPLLSNLLAGIQIAITQPVKIEDSVVINNEWGWVEDITSTYLVVRTWDWRRLIVPLSWFLEQPIQNWTRETTTIIGQVRFYVDYRTPIEDLRQELDRLIHASKLWDGNVATLQVVEANETTIQIRVLATSSDAGRSWDLQCELREKMIAYLQREHPDCLPRRRIEVTDGDPARSEFPPPRSRSFPAGARGS